MMTHKIVSSRKRYIFMMVILKLINTSERSKPSKTFLLTRAMKTPKIVPEKVDHNILLFYIKYVKINTISFFF